MSLVGNLEDLGLGEILQIVSLSRKSGLLTLHSRSREGKIFFRSGQVIRASSSAFHQNLGEVLVQKGVIDLPTLKKSLAIQETEGFRERLGTILIKHYGVTTDAIEQVVREQIENVVYSLFAWAEGTFDFELQDNIAPIDNTHLDPVQFMLDQGLNPQFLAMEGSRIIDERRHRGEVIDEMPVEASPQARPEESVDLAFDLIQASSVPVVEAAAPAADLPAEAVEVPEFAEPVAARQLVLVDDDTTTREIMVSSLQECGYEVFDFEGSEDALIKIDTLYREDIRPTLLVDLIMPRMDGSGILGGLELLDLVHTNFPELPVLVVADYSNSDAERKVRDMGYAFAMKPRKTELGDPGTVQGFAGRLRQELRRVEAGEAPAEWSDKVNIADELRLEMGEEFGPGRGQVEQSTGISLLRGMLEELNNPSLGGGIILLVLRFASEFMNRAVVFIVKRDEVVGLGQFGIQDREGLADSRVRTMRIPRDEESLFARVIESQQPLKVKPDEGRWNRYLIECLGGEYPAEIFAGPIVSEGKVVAVLYGDNLPEQKPVGDTDSLEIFLSQAGMAMEKVLLQRRLQDKSPEGL
ncbi:DUF4388 domain-containing protein [Geobacter sp. AOG1]|uniref:DUF4388 domain-containing protein n=1 Tax=Geobacter sp. AOG1 TaxID=1566346 RepID=UPI001CC68E23|nr:DUF4388 domain-containing protein [Geobacter sp. AOG1]GFE58164.1 hypothetical protein AOG1_20440 [Geobacter sp. AOG1]